MGGFSGVSPLAAPLVNREARSNSERRRRGAPFYLNSLMCLFRLFLAEGVQVVAQAYMPIAHMARISKLEEKVRHLRM